MQLENKIEINKEKKQLITEHHKNTKRELENIEVGASEYIVDLLFGREVSLLVIVLK